MKYFRIVKASSFGMLIYLYLYTFEVAVKHVDICSSLTVCVNVCAQAYTIVSLRVAIWKL